MKSQLLLVVTVIAACCPAFARTKITLDNIIYELKAAPDGTGDGVATVIGNDFSQSESSASRVDITIPEYVNHDGKTYTVTDIGASAFENCGEINAVYVPATVQFIRSKAFYNARLRDFCLSSAETIVSPDALSMNAVSRLILPETMTAYPVTAIGKNNILITYSQYDKIEDDVILSYDGEEVICAFVKKQGSYEIPASVTVIDKSAFLNCDKLTKITGGQVVESIGDAAFMGCSLLTGFTACASVETIGNNTFRDCVSLTDAIVFDKLKSIGNDAFRNCSSLPGFIAGTSLETVGANAFRSCSALTSVQLAENVTSVGDNAFTDCSELSHVLLGENIEHLGTYIFLECTKLSDVEVRCEMGTVPQGMFKNCGLTAFPITGGIREIDEEAFSGNPFGTVRLPEGLEIIGDNAFCFGSTTEVYFPSTLKRIGWLAFYHTSLENIYCAATIPPTVERDAFWNIDRDLWHNLPDYAKRHVYVPASPDHSVLELYKNNYEWGLFKNIHEDANMGVAGVEADPDAPEEYFNIDGMRLSSRPTAPGIYIMRKGTKTVKIML